MELTCLAIYTCQWTHTRTYPSLPIYWFQVSPKPLAWASIMQLMWETQCCHERSWALLDPNWYHNWNLTSPVQASWGTLGHCGRPWGQYCCYCLGVPLAQCGTRIALSRSLEFSVGAASLIFCGHTRSPLAHSTSSLQSESRVLPTKKWNLPPLFLWGSFALVLARLPSAWFSEAACGRVFSAVPPHWPRPFRGSGTWLPSSTFRATGIYSGLQV